MTTYNLAARRAARAGGEPHRLELDDGVTLTLPAALPLIVAEELMAGRFTRGLSLLFGGDEAARRVMVGHGLDVADVTDLLSEVYGMALGESRPSTGA